MVEALALAGALIRHRALAIRRDWKSKPLYGFALVAGVAVFLAILLGTFSAVRVLVNASAIGLLRTIPAWAFLIYLFTDVLIAFGQALGDLYLSRDMPILIAMPLRIPSIVAAKFVLGVAQNEVYAVVFLLPFAAGYLLGMGAAWWTIPVAFAAILVFPATLYAALVVATIAVLRIVPAKAAKEGLWLIGASVPTVFWFLSFYKVAHITGDVASMRLPSTPGWLPSTWIGEALSRLGAGDDAAAFAWLALLGIATFLAAPIALVVVARTFERGWSGATTLPARRVAVAQALRSPRSPAHALARKDLLTFARSPQLWFNHIAALGFVGYLVVGHSVQSPLLALTPQLAMLQIGFTAVLGAINPGMTAISLEHASVWVMRAAPLTAQDIVRSKFGVAYLQTGLVAAVGAAALATAYGFAFWADAAIVAFALASSATSVAVGIAFDASHPSFDWDNPNQINRGVRMVVPFLDNVGWLIAAGIALYALRAVGPPAAGLAAGVAVSFAVMAVVGVSALRTARIRIAALEV